MIVDAIANALRFAGTKPASDDFWYTTPLAFGTDVTADTAPQTTAVFACVNVLARATAMLPLRVMEDLGDRHKRKATDHPLYRTLHTAPNHWQTSFEFRQMMAGHLALRGNAYAAKVPDGNGVRLVPLHPDRMKVFVLESTRLGYLYRNAKGTQFALSQDEVMHLRGFGTDGVLGLSPVAMCHRAIELAQQGENHGLKFFRNAAKPGGILKMPAGQTLKDDDDFERVKREWLAAHGSDNLYSIAILEDGMEWQQLGMSNADAQYLESRRFQIPEICRIFNVPPHMVFSAIEHGHTYANIEQTDLAFVKHTMLPLLVLWEQTVQRDLLEDPFYAKFAVEGLLRADSATRAAFYEKLFRMGTLSQNDIREMEDRDPIDGGDEYRVYLGTPSTNEVDGAGNGNGQTAPIEQPLVVAESPASHAENILAAVWAVGDKVSVVNGKVDGVGTGVGQVLENTADIKHGQRELFDGIEQLADRTEASAVAVVHTLEEHHQQDMVGHATTTTSIDAIADNHHWYDESIEDAACRVAAAQAKALQQRAKHAATDRERFDAWVVDYFGTSGDGWKYAAKAFARFVPAAEIATVLVALASVVITSSNPVKLAETWETDCASLMVARFTKGKTDDN